MRNFGTIGPAVLKRGEKNNCIGGGGRRGERKREKEKRAPSARTLASGCSPVHQEVVQRPCSSHREETNFILPGTALQLVLPRKMVEV